MATIKTLERKAGSMARGKLSPKEYRRMCLCVIHDAESWWATSSALNRWIELRSDDYEEIRHLPGPSFRERMSRYPKGFEQTLAKRIRQKDFRSEKLDIVNCEIPATGGPDARDFAAFESFCLFVERPAKRFPEWILRPIQDVESDLREIAARRPVGELKVEVAFFCITEQGRKVAEELKRINQNKEE